MKKKLTNIFEVLLSISFDTRYEHLGQQLPTNPADFVCLTASDTHCQQA